MTPERCVTRERAVLAIGTGGGGTTTALVDARTIAFSARDWRDFCGAGVSRRNG
jgi:hypothetical protein